MKHKQDAINEATKIIELHSKNISDQSVLIKTALITCEYSQTRDDSLKQRTLNYLRELVYGKVISEEIHALEIEINKLRHKLYFAIPLDLLSKIDDIRNKISELEEKLEKLTKKT